MGFWSKLKGELIDIIEWLDSSDDTMVYRFERKDNEIKNGAKLTVRESQVAVFINEGKIADVFGPGMYTLETSNLPILSTLKGWKYGFNSPFKAEVYFLNTKQFTDQKWGTPNPIMLRDPDFGMVRIRAFGSYSMKVTDPVKFIQEIVGTDDEFSTDEISSQLRTMTITRFTDAIGESKIPVLDLAASYDELSKFCQTKLSSEFTEYGLEITKFLIANISLPPAVEEAIDRRSGVGAMGGMNQYSQAQQADAMRDAAQNESGAGMQNMMGMAMMQQMMNNQNQQQNQQNQNQQNQQNQNQQQNTPPPPPPTIQYYVSVNGQQTGPFPMNTLQQMVSQNQLTRETFVWKQGMSGWLKAGEVQELASLFNAMPPPPPPM